MQFLASIIRKEIRHMLRDPWTLAAVTVGAALLLLLMAYTFSAEIGQVPLAVWDADRPAPGRAYLQHFTNDKFFTSSISTNGTGKCEINLTHDENLSVTFP